MQTRLPRNIHIERNAAVVFVLVQGVDGECRALLFRLNRELLQTLFVFRAFRCGVAHLSLVPTMTRDRTSEGREIHSRRRTYRKTLRFLCLELCVPVDYDVGTSHSVHDARLYACLRAGFTLHLFLRLLDFTLRDRKSTRLNSSHTDISRMP